MDCNIRVSKTKALISCTVTAQLICVFVFSYAKSRFSPNETHMSATLHVADGCSNIPGNPRDVLH